MRQRLILAIVTIATSAAMATSPPAGIDAKFHDGKGKAVGTASLRETPHGILIEVALDGVPEGPHALHLHDKGVCQAPFESAGPHWNPKKRKHGFASPQGAHAGDLPNLHVPAGGALESEILAPNKKLAELIDGDGTALVIHAKADDHETDPAGAAGDRIACAAIVKP